jgi:hypothetical protein
MNRSVVNRLKKLEVARGVVAADADADDGGDGKYWGVCLMRLATGPELERYGTFLRAGKALLEAGKPDTELPAEDREWVRRMRIELRRRKAAGLTRPPEESGPGSSGRGDEEP